MSATTDQTLDQIQAVLNSLDGVILELGPTARKAIGDALLGVSIDLENALFDLECEVEQ